MIVTVLYVHLAVPCDALAKEGTSIDFVDKRGHDIILLTGHWIIHLQLTMYFDCEIRYRLLTAINWK
jgi:hypothetical protein